MPSLNNEGASWTTDIYMLGLLMAKGRWEEDKEHVKRHGCNKNVWDPQQCF